MRKRKLGVAIGRVLEVFDGRTPATFECCFPQVLTAFQGVVRLRFARMPSSRRCRFGRFV
jgi:hypothetical protein